MRRDDGPDAFKLSVGKPHGRKTEPGGELLFTPDALCEFLTGFHVSQNTRLSHDCPEK